MINSKTLKRMQFEDILGRQSFLVQVRLPKNKTLNLLPVEDVDKMRAVLSETRQAYDLFKYETSFDLAADDVSEICSLLAWGRACL